MLGCGIQYKSISYEVCLRVCCERLPSPLTTHNRKLLCIANSITTVSWPKLTKVLFGYLSPFESFRLKWFRFKMLICHHNVLTFTSLVILRRNTRSVNDPIDKANDSDRVWVSDPLWSFHVIFPLLYKYFNTFFCHRLKYLVQQSLQKTSIIYFFAWIFITYKRLIVWMYVLSDVMNCNTDFTYKSHVGFYSVDFYFDAIGALMCRYAHIGVA